MNKTIIDKDWWFNFTSASANLFTYECDTDENLDVVVDVYELSDVDFDDCMSFGDLIGYDQVDVYYNNELVEWELM